jgi:hypothetical protein
MNAIGKKQTVSECAIHSAGEIFNTLTAMPLYMHFTCWLISIYPKVNYKPATFETNG